MKIKYLKLARDDLIWFRAYYRRVFSAGQENAKTQFRRILNMISAHPDIGNMPDDFPNAREHPIAKTPFSVIYRMKDNELQILRVLDQRNTYSNERKR